MHFIGRHIEAVGIALLAAFAIAATALYFDAPQLIRNARAASGTYTCPMHPHVQRAKPGRCPDCNMNLVLADAANGEVAAKTSGHDSGCCAGKGSAEKTSSGTMAGCPHSGSGGN